MLILFQPLKPLVIVVMFRKVAAVYHRGGSVGEVGGATGRALVLVGVAWVLLEELWGGGHSDSVVVRNTVVVVDPGLLGPQVGGVGEVW